MKESTIVHELRLLHKRCEQLTMANNMLTNAYSEIAVRIRAYENLIHRGFITKRFIKLDDVESEIARVNQEEITLKQAIDNAKQEAVQTQQKKNKAKMESKQVKKKIKQKKAQLNKILKKGN